MRLTCPACGALASAEVWAAAIEARHAWEHTLLLPAVVQRELWTYLALFRPEARLLTWRRVSGLLASLRPLVEAPTLVWERRPALPNRPEYWAHAMLAMTERREQLRLPMKNHHYLRAMAYELAGQPAQAAPRRVGPFTASTATAERSPDDLAHAKDAIAGILAALTHQQETAS